MQVFVENPNTIVIDVDQGRQGRGIQNITYTEVSGQYFLIVTYTDGTTETLGPLVVTGGAAFLLGGNTGSIPYQSAPNTTVFLPIGTQNQVVVAGATAPQYTSALTGLTVNNSAIGNTAPSTGAFTNLSASGTFALTGDQVQISEGGTGQTTANGAFNALAPSQTGNAGKYLKTDGTNTAWDQLDISTADITGTLPIANGGTGQTTANSALNALLPTQAAQSGKYLKTDGTNASWDQLDISTADITGVLPVANGGTGASTAAGARANLSAAILGTNNDITSMTGVTGGISTPDFVQFDTTATEANAVGKVYWDAAAGTLDLGLLGGNVISRIGQSLVAYVTNAEAVTITKGQAVYLFSAQGNRASVKLASNLADATSAKTFGVVAENIPANGAGFIMCQGVLEGLNLGAYTAGDTLYLGATPGSLTATKPYAPNHLVYVGLVERANAGNGQLYVKVQNGYELDEIHDVQIINPQNGQTIIYDASTSLWKNANLTAGSGISVTNGAASITVSNTGVLSFSGGTTGLTPSTSTTGAVTLGGTLNIASGGTGQTTANASFNALAPSQTGNAGKYLKTDGTNSSWDLLDISTSDITGTLPVANGGTGATTAAGALTNLNAASQSTTISAGTGLTGGGDLSTNRTISIANTTVTAGAYGSASNTLTATVNAQGQLTALAATPIAIANTQISGLGTMSTQNASSVSITGGTITGITDLAVADGGTGASDASTARSNLGAAASATTISAGTGLSGGGDLSANRTLSIANTTVTAGAYGSASNTLTATVNAQGQLTALAATPIAIANTQISGLGTMSTQNSNSVTITGGSITGITDLAIADGGTGASTASGARTNLGLGTSAVLDAGVALGVATLDAGGTVPLSQLPASIQGGVNYQGSWNASTNTPTIVSSVGSKGYYYVVSVAGSTNINGITDWLPGDWIIFNGSVWQKIDNTDAVASVNGYTGVVVLNSADVGAPPTSRTITAGTGLTGGGDLSANRTISIANTTVAAGSYGSASSVGTFTVNGQGQLTAAASTPIAITNTQVSGLGTMSTQNASAVAITGGSITGITDLAVADGGTGASDAVTARTNLGAAASAITISAGMGLTGGGDLSANRTLSIANTTVTAASYGSASSVGTFTVNAQGQLTAAASTPIAIANTQVSGLGTMSTQNANAVAITGGSVDGAIIGGTTRAAGSFTTLTLTNALGIANGGTNGTATPTAGAVAYGTGTAYAFTPAGTSNQVLISNGAAAPSWANLSSLGVTSFSGGTTGLTPSTGTAGAVTLGGTLATTNGGTGLTSFTANRVFYASSTSAIGQSANLTFDGTTLTAANFTDSSLTSGRVTYATTGGNLTDSANLLYSGTDLTVYGITVGRGAGAVSTNTAVGASALAANTTGVRNVAVGSSALILNQDGGQNIAIGDLALSANVSGGRNVAIGASALAATTGSFNVAIGASAGAANTTGAQNTAVGRSSLNSNTTGSDNSAFGFLTLGLNTTGSQNTAFGREALYFNTTASNNTAVGYQAGYSNTTGIQNTAIGGSALRSNTTANNSTAVGFVSLYNSTGSDNTAVGSYATYSNTTGAFNAAFGSSTMQFNTTGSYNSAFGALSLYTNTTGVENSAFGYYSLGSNTTGAYNTALGKDALRSNTTASFNTAVGYQAGYSNTTGQVNTAVGSFALYFNTTGADNTAVGYVALNQNTTGNSNTAVGRAALNANTTASFNSAFGFSALTSNTTGASNTAMGYYSMLFNTTGANNVAIGENALRSNTTASSNTAIGFQAAYANTTGVGVVAVGRQALFSHTVGSRNTGVGDQALYSTTTAADNAGFGAYALISNSTGASNTAVGSFALYSNTTASNNTAVGYQAGYSNVTGVELTALGYRAAYSNTGSYTTAIGYTALYSNTSGVENTAVGDATGYSNTTGYNNTAIGSIAFYANTTGQDNSSVGRASLRLNTTGSYNTAVGSSALYFNTTASYNSALGTQALYSNTTGNLNTAVGFQAQYGQTTATQNTSVGMYALYSGTGSSNVAMGYLAMGDSGKDGSQNVAIGVQALQKSTTGSANTALGFNALYNNTTAANNTAVGYQAAYNTNTASNNTAVGFQALFSNTTGASNIAIGNSAGNGNTTGTANIAIGSGITGVLNAALSNQTTGSSNVAIGSGALSQINGSYSNNTAIGREALFTASGSTNTAIGYQSGSAITTGSKNTIIGSYSGNQGGLDIRTASNNIVLSDGDGNPRQVIDSSGRSIVGAASNTSSGDAVQAVGRGAVTIYKRATLANGGTLDIVVGTSNICYWSGFLCVLNSDLGNGAFRTTTNFSVIGNNQFGPFSTAVLHTQDGASGSRSFTVTYIATGIIRVTNTSGNTCVTTISFFGGGANFD